jgi:hypothetical protein
LQLYWQVWWSAALSAVVAVPLKWSLMILAAMFGALFGFIAWVDATIILGIECFLHVRHVVHAAKDTQKAAAGVAAALRPNP